MFYILLDLEASCWNPESVQYQQEIIEIGACKINSYLEIEEKFTSLVKPVLHPNLSFYCKQLTNISQEEINRAKTFDVVTEKFIDWCDMEDNHIILYTWGAKDFKWLLHDSELHNLDSEWLYANVDLKTQYSKIKSLTRPVGLDKALSLEDMEFEGMRHRALPDALNLSKLFIKYFDKWEKL